VDSGNVCRCSSIGREYTRPLCLSVNTTSAQDPGSTLCQSAMLIKSNDEIPFRSTTCARTTLPTLWSHSTLATRSFQKSAKHRAPFAPTMRSRHRTLSSGALGDSLKSSAAVRWALSALHGAPVFASSTNNPEFRGAGTPSTSDGKEGIDHVPLSFRASV
jgi:hypothetical protein